MKKIAGWACICAVSLIMTACGGGSGSGGNGGGGGGGGGVSVTITPRGLNVPINLTQQFTATVTGSSNTAVTWAVAGSGCSGTACGSISSNGLYSAPSSIPNPPGVTITATSSADSTKKDSTNITITHINVAVAPASATVALNGTQQFSGQLSPGATVTGWSVAAASGTTCSGSACGTVNSVGLYTAPTSLPSGNPPKVVVTASTEDPSPSGTPSATVTLVSSFNSRLNGHYAFHFSGFDANGPVYIVGAFQADGMGNITNGIEDINSAAGVSQSQTFSGSYALDSNNHGTVTLGASTYKCSVGSGGEAIIVEFDSTGVRGSGVIDTAQSNNFSAAKIAGSFSTGLFGTGSASERVGAAGLFTLDGVSGVTLNALDVNDAGTVVPTQTATGGTYTVNTTNGRGTMTVSVSGGATYNFGFYVVASGELFVISLDPVTATNPRLTGLAVGQAAGPFNASSLNGTGVFNLTGLNNTGANVVALGNLVTDGAGNVASGSVFDANNAGSIISQQALTGTYTMDASGDGRGTIAFTGSAPAASFVFYIIDVNKAFVLDTSTSSALSGFLEPQNTGSIGSFSPQTLQGVFISGTTSTANTAAADISAALSFDGSSTFSGTQDVSSSGGNTSAQSVSGTYTVTATGRGTQTLTAPAASNRVLYVVNSSKYYSIGVDASDTTSTVMSAQR